MSRASASSVPACRRPGPLALAISIALLATGGGMSSALAQQAAQQQEAAPAAEDSAADAKELDAVVVTGSRIRRAAGFEGPAPITTLDAEAITASGHTQISDVINQIPGFAVTQTNQTSNQAGSPGINALDLRGMGVQRTLTLIDGRRQVPSIPGTSGVDLSMLPSSLVERVEVITGGASALYGADAVNGVANIILKDNYEGLEASVRYGDSTRGDMPNYGGDVLFGKNFADYRGNFTLYGFWEKNSGEVTGQDRPWTAGGYPFYDRAGTSGPYELTDGNRNIYNSPNAHVVLGNCTQANWADCLYTFSADGQLRRPQLGPGGITNLTPTANVLVGGVTDGGEYGGRYDSWYLAVPSDRQSVRGSLSFDFNDAARLFSSLTYSESQSQSSWRGLNAYGTGGPQAVPVTSPFITQAMIDANGGAFTNPISFARHFDDEIGRTVDQYDRELLQAVVGLRGDFQFLSRDWNYSGYYSWGRSTERNRRLNGVSDERFHAGLNSTVDGAGNPACSGAWVWDGAAYVWTPAAAGCVAVNPFQRLTPGMVDWLTYDTDWSDTTMTQRVASAYAGGGLFDLPGGEVQLVVGAEYRKERNDIGVIPQFNPDDPRYDPMLGGTATPLIGEYSVKEAFAEMHLPLLRDLPFAHRLSLDLAGRLSDYSTAGRTTTTKLGAEWSPIQDITFRGTYGKAIRAPNIGELYTAGSVGGAWITDPCNDYNLQYRVDRTEHTATNCAIINPSISDVGNYWQWRDIIESGNIDLKPETAKTKTFGVVLQPRFIDNLVVSADYYSIDLRGVIAGLGFQTILNRCVDLASLDNQFCGLITRDVDGNLVDVSVQQLNLEQSKARGVDINASWFRNLSGGIGGRVSVDMSYSRTLERKDIHDAEAGDYTEYLGVFGTPKWKGTIRTGWTGEKTSLYWTLRHIDKMRAGVHVTEENYRKAWAGSVFYNDFYGTYRIMPKVSVFAGMNNAFDRAPPRVPGAEAGGANFNQGTYQAGLYDVIGRTYHVGLRVSM